jgi:predicted lipid carrier protein YhbT/chorismate mutase
MKPEPASLRGLRGGIDVVDDLLIALVAARGVLVGEAARCKRRVGAAGRDPSREQRVHERARSLARRLGVHEETAMEIIAAVVGDACRRQGLATDLDQGRAAVPHRMIPSAMSITDFPEAPPRRWLRFLPPPSRCAPLLGVVPPRVQGRLFERAMKTVLDAPLASGALDFMRGRRLGIEVTDLALRWVVEMRDGRLHAVDGAAEATVRGTATDLLLLAARLEDADTLFFQRRLVLTGDTELGLNARNVLDRLPWESVPLALRIVLNRGARLAREARAAHQAGG